MSPLFPESDHYLDHEALKPLFDYAETIPGITIFLVKSALNSNDVKAKSRFFSWAFKEKDWPKYNRIIDLVQFYENIKEKHQKSTTSSVSYYRRFDRVKGRMHFFLLTQIDSPQNRPVRHIQNVMFNIWDSYERHHIWLICEVLDI